MAGASMYDFSYLTKMTGTSSTLRKLVETGEVERILATLGGNELRAAIMALQSAASSGYPHREVESAIGHLRSAFMAYRNIWSSRGFVTIADQVDAIEKDIWTCSLIALCYAYLNERALMMMYLEEAEVPLQHSMSEAKKPSIPTKPIHLIQGLAVFAQPIKHWKATNGPFVSPAEFSSFRRHLEAYCPPS
jgi:hypothetical protein